MILKLINFLRGYLIISAESFFPERFINLCMRKGIYLWDVKKEGKSKIGLCVSVRGFRRMREPARSTKTRVHIEKRCGLPLFLHKYRHRKAFAAGIVIFLSVVIFLCSFIWSIEIRGLKKIDEKELRNVLNSCGIDIGVIKYNKNITQIKDRILTQIPELSWVWVYINGTRAVVEVKEKTEKPEIVPADVPCNVVAARDGVIYDYIVKRGSTVVKRGDTVKKGDLLISGAVDRGRAGVGFVHSEASVKARTWHEKTDCFDLFKKEEIKSGQFTKRYSLGLFGLKVPLWIGNKEIYERSTEEENVHQLKLWGDFYLPVYFSEKIIEETTEEITSLTEDQAKEYFGNKLFLQIKEELPEGTEIINKQYLHTINKQGKIQVTCIAECVEEISEYKIISIGENN